MDFRPILYHTRDGGKTLQPLNLSSIASEGLSAVSFADAQTGYILTETGRLLRTDDGGKNWIQLH